MDWVKSFVATVRDSVATPVNNPGVAETPGKWTYVIAAFMQSFGLTFFRSLRTPSSVSKLKQLYKIFSETKSDQVRTPGRLPFLSLTVSS